MTPELTTNSSKTHARPGLDYRIIVCILLAVIAVMLLMWKPWAGSGPARTVQVTGHATLRAAPDEFVFYPTYQVQNADKQAALDELTKKTETVAAKLQELGVADSAIKTSTSGYDYLPVDVSSGKATYTAQLTVTINKQELAQKVQDYLLTTGPTGSVSPQYGFSDAKQKELETKARGQATKEARAQAEQMGKNLGFTVGKVKSVTDGTGFDGPIPLDVRAVSPTPDKETSTQTLYPGENELPYSVTVVYFIR